MSSTSEPVHLNNHHRNTLRQIFQHPVSHNIEWHSVASLLEAVGSVVENHDGTVAATVGSETEYFEAPAHKDIDTQTVPACAGSGQRRLRDRGWARGRQGPRGLTVVSLPARRQVITLGTGRRIADGFLQSGRVSLLIDDRDDVAARNAESARVIINAHVDDAETRMVMMPYC